MKQSIEEMEKQIKEVKERKVYKAAMQIVAQNRKVSDRESELNKKGIAYKTCPMGSGGVGQVKIMSDHIRIQVGYGVGKHNYATAVIIKK